jgi:hypothetical protein
MCRRFVHPLLGPHQPAIGDSDYPYAMWSEELDQQFRELRIHEMGQEGQSPPEIAERLRFEDSIKGTVRNQQLAYLGWLVTEQRFRRSRDRFRSRWQTKVRDSGGLPWVPISVIGEAPTIAKSDHAYYDA